LAKKVNKIFGAYFSAELALIEKADKKIKPAENDEPKNVDVINRPPFFHIYAKNVFVVT